MFIWNSQYDKIYQQAKNYILDNVITLCYYDPNLPLSLETDASQSGIAVLLQEGRPIAFMSRALAETQSRYSNIEREILGIVTGIEYFHQYLFGRKFILYTDHKPMENLVLKPLIDTSPRIQRLMLRLTQYHMDVVYKSGKSMLVSDCLSRMANPTTNKEDESLNLQIMSIEQEQCITLSEVKKALTEDPVNFVRRFNSQWMA